MSAPAVGPGSSGSPLLLGIDVGTTGAKAVLLDSAGQVAAVATTEYPLLTPRPGWTEQDPTTWWEAAVTSIRRVLNEVRVREHHIAAVGLTGQMHGLVPLDGGGSVLRPAILWNDQRTAEECAWITGRNEGTPVVGGAGDQAAQAVGTGIVRTGLVSATIGTSGVVFAHLDQPAVDLQGRLHSFCHAVPSRWHVMGVMLSAGGALRWLRDGVRHDAWFKGGDPYDAMSAEAAEVSPGCEGLVFLPYLTGERTPHADPRARGAFVGLTLRHHHGHLIRAVMEGVALGLRDSLELIRGMGLPVTEIRVSGGGARSPLWRQILADVFRTDVATVTTTEGAAYGAALLAGGGRGVFPSVEAACEPAVG